MSSSKLRQADDYNVDDVKKPCINTQGPTQSKLYHGITTENRCLIMLYLVLTLKTYHIETTIIWVKITLKPKALLMFKFHFQYNFV